MAEEIDVPAPRRRRYYPWEQWLNGNVWRTYRGVDFTVSVNNFQTALHQRARLENMTVVTGSPEPDVVEFCFTPNKLTDDETL